MRVEGERDREKRGGKRMKILCLQGAFTCGMMILTKSLVSLFFVFIHMSHINWMKRDRNSIQIRG
jgi:hypothetical protein